MDFSQEIELLSVSLIAVVNVTDVCQVCNRNAGKSSRYRFSLVGWESVCDTNL